MPSETPYLKLELRDFLLSTIALLLGQVSYDLQSSQMAQ